MKINPIKIRRFKSLIWEFYKSHKRDLPWRNTADPYRIFISEVMLQQTQVSRVLVTYQKFLNVFPNFSKLSKAPLRQVLRVWQGMGYNRRAKYLLDAAKIVVEKYAGKLPNNQKELDTLPGIGYATASSISAFAFNTPYVFIETNIRRVFIHHFFKDRDDIDDDELIPLIVASLDTKNPREWYWALMDYGSFLTKKTENPNRRSKHYTKQTSFNGSDRQIRGLVLKSLLDKSKSIKVLSSDLDEPIERVEKILDGLVKENIVTKKNNIFSL